MKIWCSHRDCRLCDVSIINLARTASSATSNHSAKRNITGRANTNFATSLLPNHTVHICRQVHVYPVSARKYLAAHTRKHNRQYNGSCRQQRALIFGGTRFHNSPNNRLFRRENHLNKQLANPQMPDSCNFYFINRRENILITTSRTVRHIVWSAAACFTNAKEDDSAIALLMQANMKAIFASATCDASINILTFNANQVLEMTGSTSGSHRVKQTTYIHGSIRPNFLIFCKHLTYTVSNN